MNNILRSVSIAFAALVFVALSSVATPVAHAADLGSPDYGWVDTGSYDTYSPSYSSSPDYGWTDTGYYDTYSPSYTTSPDYGWVDTGYYNTYTPSYDTYTPSSSYYPSYYGYTTPVSQPSSNTVVQQQQQQQTSTNVNNNVNNNNVVVNVPSSSNNDHSHYNNYQPSCASGYYGTYPNCYRPQPVVYNNPSPYVALTAVPYTGLDLGPVGTALYWSFLVLVALFGAYLIVVKRTHMSIYRWYKKALFGEDVPAAAMTPAFAGFSQNDLASLANMLRSVVDGPRTATAKAAAPEQNDGVDPFIRSQINRAHRA